MESNGEEQRPVESPCEDCGGQFVAGLEPFERDNETDTSGVAETRFEWSEWCVNLSCASNYALRGLHRVGVNDFVCLTCGELLRAPTAGVAAQVRAHGSQEPQFGSYTYVSDLKRPRFSAVPIRGAALG